MNEPERLDLRFHDIAAFRREELLHVFPEVRTEDGKINFDKLQRLSATPKLHAKIIARLHYPTAIRSARRAIGPLSRLSVRSSSYADWTQNATASCGEVHRSHILSSSTMSSHEQ